MTGQSGDASIAVERNQLQYLRKNRSDVVLHQSHRDTHAHRLKDQKDMTDRTQLAHIVFFTLTEPSSDVADALVAACHKYLKGHDGEVYFSAGSLVEDLNRPVNDHDFDVALHVVFASRQAHDDYQIHERHQQFIEENKAGWKQVRVFDSYVR